MEDIPDSRCDRPSPYTGEANPRARLTEAAVAAIRESSLPYSKLAAHYGVSVGAIKAARVGLSWAHLLGASPRYACPIALPGEAHQNSKLRAADVPALRAGAVSSKTLQERYGVTRAAIWKARNGVTWKHLPMGGAIPPS